MSSTAVFERLYRDAFVRDHEVVAAAARILAEPLLGGDVDRLAAFRVAVVLCDGYATFLARVIEPRAHEIWRRERRMAKNFVQQVAASALGPMLALLDFPIPPPEDAP